MRILGVLLILAGIALGLYVGVWLLFIGGIVGLITVVTDIANGLGVDGVLIGISIVKMMFASFIGYLSALILVVPGFHLITK